MYKMLQGTEGVEAHHEYACTHVQRIAALYFMGRISRKQAHDELERDYYPAVFYSEEPLWVDASNKLTWLIDLLVERFPEARFVGLVRDGRKVVSSYFYKLAGEMYDDRPTAVMKAWLSDPSLPPPPPEKQYWWHIPCAGNPFAERFESFDRLQRVAYHWAEANRVMLDCLDRLPPERWIVVRLEDLASSQDQLQSVIHKMGISYNPDFRELLKTPQNVFYPMDYQLTDEQTDKFQAIAQPMMDRLGYSGAKSYVVEY